jgi:hypothetical protein
MRLLPLPLLCGCLAGATPVADLTADNACGLTSDWWAEADPVNLGNADAVDAVVSTGGTDWSEAGVHGVADCGEPFAAGAGEWTPVDPGSYTIRAEHVANDESHALPLVLLVGDTTGACTCVAGEVAETELTVDEVGPVSLWIGLDAASGAEREQYWDDDAEDNGFEADYRVTVEGL